MILRRSNREWVAAASPSSLVWNEKPSLGNVRRTASYRNISTRGEKYKRRQYISVFSHFFFLRAEFSQAVRAIMFLHIQYPARTVNSRIDDPYSFVGNHFRIGEADFPFIPRRFTRRISDIFIFKIKETRGRSSTREKERDIKKALRSCPLKRFFAGTVEEFTFDYGLSTFEKKKKELPIPSSPSFF